MNFGWVLAIVFALIAMVSGSCPAKFTENAEKLCVADRPIHGSCPEGSLYKANINKCVYAARG